MKVKLWALSTFLQFGCALFSAVLSGCDSTSAGTSESGAASSTVSSVASTTTAPGSSGSKPTPSTTSASSNAASTSNTVATSATTTTAKAGATSPTATPAVATSATTAAMSSDKGTVTQTNDSDACLPISMPSADVLFSSTRKVFAHYLFPFPLSLDNRPAASDYYNDQYLNKHGEGNKWLAQGGYLRQRPLGVPSSTGSNWKLKNMEAEVRAAIARGITGFTFDVMSEAEATEADGPLALMLQAASAVDSRFKIVVMPDMTALGSDSTAVIKIIASVAKYPAAYHLSDGRLVVSAFDAGLNSAGWWKSVLAKLAAEGISIAFVPTFLGSQSPTAAFDSLTYGYGDWGTATPNSAAHMVQVPDSVHTSSGKTYMMPVNQQQFRPKDFLYWESANSSAFRNSWSSAIQGNADWVQVVTWNDFSESGQISPYTDSTLRRDIGSGYYDMNGFFTTWFLTGQQPQITHDVLYYFYRREPTSAIAPAQRKGDAIATGTAQNEIELVGFLTAPGVLKIAINGTTYSQSVAAGIVSFKVPSHAGTPVFTLSRNGTDVFSFQGGVQIFGSAGLPSGVEDLTYWSGSASQSGICSL